MWIRGSGHLCVVWVLELLRGAVHGGDSTSECPEPEPVLNAYRDWSDGDLELYYMCADGHKPGTLHSRCYGSYWEKPSEECRVDCGPPPTVDGASVAITGTQAGDIATYECWTNFTYSALSTTYTCSAETARWFRSREVGPFCVGKDPLPLPVPLSLTDDDQSTCETISSLTFEDENKLYNIDNMRFYVKNMQEPVLVAIQTILKEDSLKPCGELPSSRGDGEYTQSCQLNHVVKGINISSADTFKLCELYVYGREYIGDCGRPPVIMGAMAEYDSTTFGSMATYDCVSPYAYTGGSNVVACDMWRWRTPTIVCEELERFPISDLPSSRQNTFKFELQSNVEVQHIVIMLSNVIKFPRLVVGVEREKGGVKKECIEDGNTGVFGTQLAMAFHCPNFPIAKWVDVTTMNNVIFDSVDIFGRSVDNGALECIQTDEGHDYKGKVDFTLSGKPCIPWIVDSLDDFPDFSLEELGRNCRSRLSVDDAPLCYVDDCTLEYCPVPHCDDMCRHGVGRTYQGDFHTSSSGHPCLSWESLEGAFTLHGFLDNRTENRCRNPIGSYSEPYCITMDIDGSHTFSTCAVPHCPSTFEVLTPVLPLMPVWKCLSMGNESSEIVGWVYSFYTTLQQQCVETGICTYLCYDDYDWTYIRLNDDSTYTGSCGEATTESFIETTENSPVTSTTTDDDVTTENPPVTSATPDDDLTTENFLVTSATIDDESKEYSPLTQSASETSENIAANSLADITGTTENIAASSFTDVAGTSERITATSLSDVTESTISESIKETQTTDMTLSTTYTSIATPELESSEGQRLSTEIHSQSVQSTASVPDASNPVVVEAHTESTLVTVTLPETTRDMETSILRSTTLMTTTVPAPFRLICQCRCKMNLSMDAVSEVMEERKANLTVNPRETSAFVRKKTSASDERKSANASGVTVIAMVSVMFSVLLLPDIINIIAFISKAI